MRPEEIREYDVAVVGSGAAGLSAALTAAVHGASVIIVEKADVVGGTTALSGGCVWVPCHHHMGEIGASDSRDDALRYLRAVSPEGWHNVEDPLWVAFVDHAPRMLELLEANSPLRFAPNREPDPYAEAPGGKAFGRNVSARPIRLRVLGRWRGRVREPAHHFRLRLNLNYEEYVDTNFYASPRKWLVRFAPRLVWRALTGQRTMGNALVVGLLKGCLDHGCEVWTGARAERLVLEEGRVRGVDVTRGGRVCRLGVRRGVVLASAGFEWNAEMMAEHFPGPVEWTGSPATNVGDGHRMAAEVGARLDRMDQALIFGTTPFVYEGRLQGSPASDYLLPHSMIVNRHGRRFVNEKQANIGLAFAERDPATGVPVHLPAFRIYDGQFAAKYPHALPNRRIAGLRYVDRTLEGLARQIGVDGAGLVATARRFSDFARAGKDEDFGRGESLWDRTHIIDPRQKPNPALGSIEVPPFHAMPFKASFLATKGGVRTNAKGQALDGEGNVIPGLYAAGNVMANPFGSKGVGAGTTLGPCLTWGYICGLHALEAGMPE
jgi:3-oxosteroid 1-dehydrogenase